MKKNLVFILLTLAALASCASSAFAAGPSSGRNMDYQQVFFRTQTAANPASAWDSLTTSRVGAAGASSVLDTTVAISTAGWDIPSGSAVGDSALFAHFIVYDATTGGDCESGADSLAVAMQVSADGVTWATTAVVAGQVGSGTAAIASRNNQTIANGVFLDQLSANGAALANGQPVWSFPLKFRGNASLGSIDHGRAPLFPFIRFILSFHDAKGYIVQAKVGRFINVQP